MIRKVFAGAFLAAFAWWAGPTTAAQIAFTFDDGPDLRDSTGMSAVDRNDALLRQLSSDHIKAALFLTCGDTSEARLDLIRKWGAAGHLVGNHTTTHRNLNSASVELTDYEADMFACDQVIHGLPGYAKLFRYPFLKEGNTEAKRDGFRDFLGRNGYRVAPVSVDTSDWFYNARLKKWIAKGGDVAAYRAPYVAHLVDRVEYYDGLSARVLGRSPAHVVLLHHNLINALFLADAIRAFRKRGWTLVDAATALGDPLYAVKPDVLPAGESILWSLAKEKGTPELRYPAEDSVYEQPKLDALGL